MTNVEQWLKTEPDWLPLWRAPFYFYPDYAAPGASFQRRMGETLQSIIGGNAMTYSVANGDVVIDCLNARFYLDPESGLASIRDRDDEWRQVTDAPFDDPSGPLPELISELATLRPLPDFAVPVPLLTSAAGDLWRICERRFAIAIERGDAMIVARWGSVGAPFTPVYPDQWTYLRHTLSPGDEDETGRPVGQTLCDGTRLLYSPMVRPVARRTTPTNLAERACTGWLIGLRRNDEWASQERLEEFARQKWGVKLSRKAFKRAIISAQKSVPNKDLDRRGPKKQLVSPPN